MTKEDQQGSGNSIDESCSSGTESGAGGASNTSNTCTSKSSIQEQLSKKESEAVLKLRVATILVLIATGAAICYVVFSITRKGESEEFKTQYEGAASKVIQSFEDIAHKMGVVSSLGVALTAHGTDHEAEWPFVAMSKFQERAGNARHLSEALMVSFAPIVTRENFDSWDAYVQGKDNEWVDDALLYQTMQGTNDFETEENIERSRLTDRKVDLMHYFDKEGQAIREETPSDFYLPSWQTSPYLKTNRVNENILRRQNGIEHALKVLETKSAVFGGIEKGPTGTSSHHDPNTELFATLRSIWEREEVPYLGDPIANLYYPVFGNFSETERSVVGIMVVTIHWRAYFRNILPSNVKGIYVVLDHECGGEESNLEADTDINDANSAHTYLLSGKEALPIGYGDHHETLFSKWMKHGNLVTDDLDDGTISGIQIDATCSYDIHVFPSEEFYNLYYTSTPIVITSAIAAVLIFTIFMFLFYDRLVERRQKIILTKATQSTAIVSSLFPKNVRDRLMEAESTDIKGYGLANKSRLKGFLSGDEKENEISAAPIADLFPNCTVFFGDISGFTAWSSTREPSQVFILLQTVYQSFDALAKRRRVFKVETIGDSYMAVTGLPEPQINHATNMARFAHDCLLKMGEVTQELESTLGPDTCNLSMRFGLHSGPVTAGVLRGDRARFQLFGDTVNTASRMESTGVSGGIQCSPTTAALLKEAGKEHWLTPRSDSVKAKGKGIIKTFWVNPATKHHGASTVSSGSSSGGSETHESAEAVTKEDVAAVVRQKKTERLVDWIVKMLLDDIKKIIHARAQRNVRKNTTPYAYHHPPGKTCMDEVREVIVMEKFDKKTIDTSDAYGKVEISEVVIKELTEYVTMIALMYRNNPFHNYEHACHVTMSVSKLLKRIVAPELTQKQLVELKGKEDIASHLYDYTHGINSDPLATLAVKFSALIHDVDHRGCSNTQLMVEEPKMAQMYSNQSIAEQNSLDLAWDALMKDSFNNLRACLFNTEAELMRFRQLIVNVVLATDIFDKELNVLRKARWERAFSAEKDAGKDGDLRATIVLEHIIQASDVAHTMQHWHVYQKWNKCLFLEMSKAFKDGRLAKDPATFWYQGELGFFDNYIIPLAKKLKECGVFGVSSDEYLNYAEQNRAEWSERGEGMVKELVATREKDEAA